MNRVSGFLFAALTVVTVTSVQGVSQTSGNSTNIDSGEISKILSTPHSPGAETQPLSPSGSAVRGASLTTQEFDWTQDTILHLYFMSPSGKIVYNTAPPPMYDNACPAFSDFFEYSQKKVDIYPQEGWVLLYKDFGDSIRPAAGNPIFILYNKYRGIMRVFFWNATDTAYSYGVMRLDIVGPNSTSLVTFNSALPQFSDQYDAAIDSTVSLSSVFEIIPLNWCYADFNLAGYDPDIANKDCNFRISVYGIDASSYNESLTYPIREQTHYSNRQDDAAEVISRLHGDCDSARISTYIPGRGQSRHDADQTSGELHF